MNNESQQMTSEPGGGADAALIDGGLPDLAGTIADYERRVRLYRTILSSTPDLVYVFDLDYRFAYANQALLDMWGRTLEESVGKSLLEIGYEPWHAEMHEREIDQVITTKQPVRGEVSFPHATLGRRIYDYIFVPVFNAEGQVERVAGTTRDVTERKHAEEAQRASEARLHALVDASTDVVYRMSADWGQMLWLSGGDFISDTESPSGAWMQTYIHADDQAEVRDRIEDAIRTKSAFEFEHRVRRIDGSLGWTSSRAVPLMNDAGEIVEWFGAAADITARKETEDALRQSESRLRAVNDILERRIEERTTERDRVWRNSRDLLVVVDADGAIRAANPAWALILGHDPQEVIGRHFIDFVWPDDVERTRVEHLKAVKAQHLINFENRYGHKDGTARWISWNTAFEGDLIYGYGRDVTAEKERDEALRAAEDQLRQSQKMEAVGQLTGGLAHDFNNLLAGISGSLELINTRIAQGRIGDVARYIAAAQGGVKRAAALTHRLLAFSRRQTLDPRPIRVNGLVAGMEELIRRTVGPSVEVQVAGARDLWTTFADPNQLENALLNLCINARDAMPDGGRVTIETENQSIAGLEARERDLEPGLYIVLRVKDTGTGMAPDVMRRVFDPFFTTKPIGMGTGLGLSMIYGFAKQSGGQVRIDSEVARGTTVSIYLPRFTGEAENDETSARQVEAPRAQQGETVLVVDDEATIRMLVTDTLEELGYGAIEAIDGATAMSVLQSDRRIDLLVTDVGLPGGMNGRQIADAARLLRPGLKVLFITGYAENAAAIGSGHLETGMQVLTKPFAMEDLALRIKDIITEK